MAGLNGLKKQSQLDPDEKIALDFIAGAEKRNKALAPKDGKKFVRCTFSLNSDVSNMIDELIIKSQNARVNRSSIVRIAIEQLSKYDIEDLKKVID